MGGNGGNVTVDLLRNQFFPTRKYEPCQNIALTNVVLHEGFNKGQNLVTFSFTIGLGISHVVASSFRAPTQHDILHGKPSRKARGKNH